MQRLICFLVLNVTSNFYFFFFQAEDGIRDGTVTGVQTCALPIYGWSMTVIGFPDRRGPPRCHAARGSRWHGGHRGDGPHDGERYVVAPLLGSMNFPIDRVTRPNIE